MSFMRLDSPEDIDQMLHHYIICMLWSSTDESDESGGDPMDQNYGIDDLAPEALKECREECEGFCEYLIDKLGVTEIPGWSPEQFGHDFWLTRNGHGAGFWDRQRNGSPWESLGDWLAMQVGFQTDYPEQHAYVGDDGKIYVE